MIGGGVLRIRCRPDGQTWRVIVGPVAFLIFALSFIPAAHATVVEEASIEELATEATLVVHARVVEQWVALERGPRGEIYTQTQLEVVSYMKGLGPSTLVVQQLGGQYGDIRLHVEGNARLEANDEVVVFLDYDTETGLTYVVGLAQGLFRINHTEQMTWLNRELDGLAFYRVGTAPYEAERLVLTFEALADRIRLNVDVISPGDGSEVRP